MMNVQLSDQDRVMLSLSGGKQLIFPDGKVKIESADYDIEWRLTKLTMIKAHLSSGLNVRRMCTPTPQIETALILPNQNTRNLTESKTYFFYYEQMGR